MNDSQMENNNMVKKVSKKTSSKKVNKKIKKNPVGAQPKFDEKLLPVIKKLCLVGKTNAEIAWLLDVCEKTVYNWINAYPDLLHAMKDWKKEADKNVERSMYELAQGYKSKETKVFLDKNGDIKTYNMIKHHIPNYQAANFILANRDPDKWKNKVEHSGEVKTEFTLNYKSGDSKKPKEEDE